jgi:hypothetical protein
MCIQKGGKKEPRMSMNDRLEDRNVIANSLKIGLYVRTGEAK